MQDPVIILFGGASSERRVSVASAQHLSEIVPEAGLWFWAPDDRVFSVGREQLLGHSRAFEMDLVPEGAPRAASLRTGLDAAPRDAVFLLALHGGAGEDGTVQSWLEARRLAFTGSGSESSRNCFDKVRAKEIARRFGLRIAPSVTVSGRDLGIAREATTELWQRHGRLVKKPVRDGSSTGLGFISDAPGLDAFIAELSAAPDLDYLVEAFIDGRELTVGVVDRPGPGGVAAPVALPASEVIVERGRSFDYAGKYLGVGTREVTPAEVSDEIHLRSGQLAITAHRSLGCLGYSRTDMILAADGDLVFLETNNLPGLTRASFLPQQLAAASSGMRAFVEQQLALGRRRYPEAGTGSTTGEVRAAALA